MRNKFLLIFSISLISTSVFSQGTWIGQANYGGGGRNKAAGFSIGTKAYIGTGGNAAGGPQQDLWEWDQSTNVWSQKANYTGGVRVLAAGFSIGTKGYMGTGSNGSVTLYSDFWEFDPSTNTWSQKANFLGGNRDWAVGFSIGSKGYIGLGWDGTSYRQDIWEYDPPLNTWTQKTNFSGAARAGAVGFSIGNKGYVGTGNNSTNYYKDFWEFDPIANNWSQKSNVPGFSRSLASGFSISASGYLGLGLDSMGSNHADFYQWDQATDKWNPATSFTGSARQYAVGFSIGNHGYVGTGFDTQPAADFFEFTAPLTASITASTNVNCNGNANGSASAAANGGFPPYTYFWCNGQTTATATGLSGNTYTVTVIDVGQGMATATVSIAEPTSISYYPNTAPATCGNKDGSAGNIVQGGTPPYTFLWSNGKTTQNISGLSAGTYRMNVTDGNGCFSFVDDLVNTSNGPDAYASSVTDVSCFGLSDGNIQLSVNNGTPPYKYQWSNGNTTQNISGLSEGPYSVNVVDATGCLAVASATVGKPGKLDEYISTVGSSCKKLNGTAKIVVSGGTSPYYYQWSSGESQDSIFAKSAGVYTVQVTDSHGCTTTGWATIADSISPSILVDSIVAVDCGSNGGAYITPTDPLSVKSYWWSNGWVTQNLVGVAAGGYGCIVTDTSGCKNAWFVKVPPVMPPLKPICLVTVDTSSKVNIVVWEKPTGASNISGFNIYRESTTPDVYQRIGFSPWANLSIYFDSIPNPDNRWAKYKVAMVDICGNEGALSPEHKTIHLSIPDVTAQGVHLTWDKYEGYTFSYYEIFRKANSGGTWMKIDSVPASLNNYFDLTYNPVDTNYYHVDVPAPAGGCIPSIKYPDPDATNLNTSRSNVYKVQDSTFVGVHSLADGSNTILVFPNPGAGKFQVVSSEEKVLNAAIFNVYGEKIFSYNQLFTHTTFDISSQPAGIYFLRTVTTKGTSINKIIRQ